jgi:hypothetical protein
MLPLIVYSIAQLSLTFNMVSFNSFADFQISSWGKK